MLIIYITKDIEIFFEVPNFFEDFLSKYTILKFFEIKNVELGEKPKLDSPDDELLHIRNILDLNNNENKNVKESEDKDVETKKIKIVKKANKKKKDIFVVKKNI